MTRSKAPSRRSRKVHTSEIPDFAGTLVDDIDIRDELEQSFLEYSLAVIAARAIPDARDGLKPVHRRVLYAMQQNGMHSDRPHRKSAQAVGATMGRYHPHGDSAIYETMVRLAQDWVMRVPLADGHGNFGSRDHGPAAARYSEIRLSPAAEALLAEVSEDTVDMAPNFDATTTEPKVLPAGFPNLLVNGAQGIAVGIATSIPPHNLSDTIAAAKHLITNPKATDDDLMAFVGAPDFPTGCAVYGEGIAEMYRTGRGKFTIRARATVEQFAARRRGIVFTELPYSIGPEKIISEVKEKVNAGRIDGVADILDLTDRRNGLRLVIEVRPNADPERVLALLYRHTSLETNFAANMVALVDGKPKTCTLRELLSAYVEHRVEVIRRRSEFRLAKALDRAHILEGLLIALDRIDLVVALIRRSKDTKAARAALVAELDLTAVQADHILEMPLRRLTSLEGDKLKRELRDTETEIKGLRKILSSRKNMLKVVSDELDAADAKFGSPRMSEMLSAAPVDVPTDLPKAAAAAEVVQLDDTECEVATDGTNIWRVVDKARRSARPVVSTCATTVLSHALAVTSDGRLARVPVAELADDSTPTPMAAFVDLSGGETVVAVIHPGDDTVPLALMTAGGVVKRVAVPLLPTEQVWERAGRDGIEVISLRDGDSVVGAAHAGDDVTLVAVTSDAQLLRFSADQVRPQGRAAGGMGGVALRGGASVVAFGVVADGGDSIVVVVTDAGNAKLTAAGDYPVKGRNTGGVRCITFKRDDSRVAGAVITSGQWVLTNRTKVVGAELSPARRDASGTPTGATGVSVAR